MQIVKKKKLEFRFEMQQRLSYSWKDEIGRVYFERFG